MTDLMQRALELVRKWPPERQEEAARLLMALDKRDAEPLDVDEETLKAIDEALAEKERGEYADPKLVEAFFARFRK